MLLTHVNIEFTYSYVFDNYEEPIDLVWKFCWTWSIEFLFTEYEEPDVRSVRPAVHTSDPHVSPDDGDTDGCSTGLPRQSGCKSEFYISIISIII